MASNAGPAVVRSRAVDPPPARLLVVIPALNEDETVATVVRSVRELLRADVLVIDDGSTDRTAATAHAAGALVIQHPFNLGVGAALRTGFRYAVEGGYQTVVQIDADGQHDVADARRLIERLERDSLDIVVGNRFGPDFRIGRARGLAMRMLSWDVSRRLGVRVTDTTSGFRAFGKRAFERFARAYPSAYLSDTVEALLLAGDWGLRVGEEPVVMHARAGGTPSAGPVRSAFHLVRLTLVIALHRVRAPIHQRRSMDDVEA
jgi:glycosyltransferase involved in cell wall biosynthesis